MATPEELKRAQELEAIERRRRDMAREMQGLTASQAYDRDSVAQAASLTDYARMLTEQMKEQAGITRGRSEVDKSLLSISQQLQQSAQKITSELGNEYRVQQQIAKDRELQRKIEVEIGTIRNNLSKEQLASLTQVNSLNQSIRDQLLEQATIQQSLEQIQARIKAAENGSLDISKEALEDLNEKGIQLELQLDALDKQIGKNTDLLDIAKTSLPAEAMKLSTLEDQLGVINDIQGIRQGELKTQRKITQATGVTGAVVGGLGGIMQRLGMRSGIFNQAMDDSKNAMEEMAGKGIKGGEAVSKMAVAMKGVGILATAAAKVLTDPAVAIGAIVDGFLELNKAGVEFGQTTGMAADAMSGVHTEVSTAVDLLKTATSVTKELGLNAAAVFTPKQIGQIADMTTLLGLSEQAASRLGLMMKITGQSADQLGESVYETVSGLNEAGRSAVAPKQVLDDVLTASEDITLSLGNNPKQLAKAATAARAFGMTLSQVDKIAESLLDFESSIEAELEAQLLTGKNINMGKARELALNNDLAGLAKELEKQGVSAVEFSKMNRIQQEATAKALGMSRQELSKSLLTQEAQANMTEEQLAAARGVSLEESKRIGIQERIEKAIQKVQLAFAPVLEALVPIVENALALINPFITVAGIIGKALAAIIKFPPVLYTIQGVMAAIAAIQFKNFLTGGRSLELLAFAASRNKKLTIGQTIALKAHLAAQKLLTASKIKDTAATAQGNLVSRLATKLGKLSIVTTLKEASAKLFGAKATAALNVQSKIAATSGAAGGAGMAAFAAGIAPLGPVIPIILGLSLALVGVGAALRLAAPAISALGESIASILREVTLEKAAALVATGVAFSALGLGLMSLGTSLIFGMAGIVALGAIAAMADPLSIVGKSITDIATGVAKLSEALQSLETSKLEEVKDLISTTALAAPAIAATGAITSLIQGIAGSGEGGSDDKVVAKIQELIDIVGSGNVVELKLDSETITKQQMLSMTKSK